MTTHLPPNRITPAIARVLEAFVIDGPEDEILAKRLNCTRSNIKTHLHSARSISGTVTRTGLALWWIRVGRYEYLSQLEDQEEAA